MSEPIRQGIDATDFCRLSECDEFIVWDFGEGDCYSCKKVGQSHIIDTVPADCNKLTEILEWLDD